MKKRHYVPGPCKNFLLRAVFHEGCALRPKTDEKKEAHELLELTRIILIFFRVIRVIRGLFS
ncbi:MAG: hypothetical protein JSV88_04680, partial [Candidatus Aminicenantes bacterium]